MKGFIKRSNTTPRFRSTTIPTHISAPASFLKIPSVPNAPISSKLAIETVQDLHAVTATDTMSSTLSTSIHPNGHSNGHSNGTQSSLFESKHMTDGPYAPEYGMFISLIQFYY